eukprot:TRINITY_DN4388_c0_g1_i4.p1 TRINITY_DN4388_c0_g1~~TRINITY_DN4388_c0_g1_i4.p1  ORF type:complete len:120 (-),score=0.42 TRINITY_DN4388_c0_g1_i4:57-416(-)
MWRTIRTGAGGTVILSKGCGVGRANSGGLHAARLPLHSRHAFIGSLRVYREDYGGNPWVRMRRKAASMSAKKNDPFTKTMGAFPTSYVNRMRNYRDYQAKLDERLSKPKYRRKIYSQLL